MKKKISTIVLILAFVGIVFYGKKFIDNTAANFEETIINSLEDYNKSYNTKDLKPILNLVEKNLKDEEKLLEINNITFNRLASWSTYLNNKYVCDTSNKTACQLQLNEFTVLKNKIDTINKLVVGEDELTILNSSSYNKLNSEITKKINSLTKIYNNTATKNPMTANEKMKYNCSLSYNCTGCDSSSAKFCTCDYKNGDNISKISCPRSLVGDKIVSSK